MTSSRRAAALATAISMTLAACGAAASDGATTASSQPATTLPADAGGANPASEDAADPVTGDAAAPDTKAAPAPDQPVASSPAESGPPDTAPAGTEPAGTEPVGAEPSGTEPAVVPVAAAMLGGRAFAEVPIPRSDVETNVLPDLVVDDVRREMKANVRNIFPADRPVLLWMWAPH